MPPGITSATWDLLRDANSGSTPDLLNPELRGGAPRGLLMNPEVEKHWYWGQAWLWGKRVQFENRPSAY